MYKLVTRFIRWNRYFREAACAIVLLLISFQLASSATKPDDAPAGESGSKSAASGGSGPDVIGLRIDMPPAEARAIIKSRGFGTSTKPPNRLVNEYWEHTKTLALRLPGQDPQPIPNTKYVLRLIGNIVERPKESAEASSHSLIVIFGPVPGQEGIVSLTRQEGIPVSKKLAFDKTLVEKYGIPTDTPSRQIYSWRYDSNGTLQKPFSKTSLECLKTDVGLLNIDWYLEHLETVPEYNQKAVGCGTMLQVGLQFDGGSYAGPGTLISGYNTSLTAFDAALRALNVAKAIIEKAQADASGAATKKGQQQKPDL